MLHQVLGKPGGGTPVVISVSLEDLDLTCNKLLPRDHLDLGRHLAPVTTCGNDPSVLQIEVLHAISQAHYGARRHGQNGLDDEFSVVAVRQGDVPRPGSFVMLLMSMGTLPAALHGTQ